MIHSNNLCIFHLPVEDEVYNFSNFGSLLDSEDGEEGIFSALVIYFNHPY